jgi:hypothetical protein
MSVINNLVYYLLVSLPLYMSACRQHKASDPTSVSIHHADDLISDFNLNRFLEKYNYQLQYIDSGYINQDNLKDKVLVLQENSDEGKYLPREVIILLGETSGFSFCSESKTVMPAEYINDGYKQFDTEDVKIEDGKVVFDLYAIGPNGHIYFDFIFKDGRMALHELTGYFMGAGSHSSFTYLATTEKQGTVAETLINTMEEDMPSKRATRPVTLKSITSFEHFKYDDCIQEMMQQASLDE